MTELLSGEAPGAVAGSLALSARDQERVSRGESPEDLVRADYEHDALSGIGGGLDTPEPGGSGSNDARLKRDVPPHWG